MRSLLHFLNDWQNHRTAAGLFKEITAQSVTDVRLDGCPFLNAFFFAAFQCLLNAGSGFVHQCLRLPYIDETAGYDIRAPYYGVGGSVHGHDDNQDAVLRQLAAVTEHDIAHVAYAKAINHNHASGNLAGYLTFVLGKFKDIAVLAQEDMVFGHTEFLRQFGMLYQMMVFAMNRDEEP